jgi:hypothetical protein
MNARILNADEWGKVEGTPISALLPYVDPSDVAVVVVEDGDRIVARWCVFRVTHLEGIWIDPEYRGNAGVIRPLLRQAFAVPRVRGERWAFSGADDSPESGLDKKVDRLLRRIGGERMPVRFYAIPIPTGDSELISSQEKD